MDLTFQDGENLNEQVHIVGFVSFTFGDKSHGFSF